MADCSKKILTTVNSILYLLTFSQFAVNTAISQNMFQNVQFKDQISAAFQKLRRNYNDPVTNKSQVSVEDRVGNNFQDQYEPPLLNIPNESPKLSNAISQYDDKADSKKSPTEILNDIQLRNNFQLPNNVQFINNFLLSLTNIFPGLIVNNNPSELRDGRKRVRATPFKDIESVSQFFNRYTLKLNISLECLTSLNDFQIGIKDGKLWAIRMIDSFGKIPNGILDGTLRSFGDYDMCLDTELPGKYRGMYCTVVVMTSGNHKKRMPFQPVDLSLVFNRDFSRSIFGLNESEACLGVPITTSICLPSNCSKTEVQNILTEVIDFGYQSINLGVQKCETRKEFHLNEFQFNILSVMIVIFLFEVFATILDLRLRYFYKEEFDKIELSKTVQCTLAFSFYSNIINIFKMNKSSYSIKIFHGMKVISLSWIVLGHTLIFYLRTLGRLHNAYLVWSGFFFQLFTNVHGPETFFFISGFLVMYSFIKANKSQISFVHYALGRFIRLMPPVLFIIGCVFLLENLSSGPMWEDYVSFYLVGSCKATWWWNLLFINNIVSFKDSCLHWTWYIAADMQLYLISYFLLILMRTNPEKAVLALKVIIIGSVGGLVIYHAAYNLPPHPLLIYVHYLDREYYTAVLHARTYNHVTPYFLGMFTAYLIASNKKIILTGRRQILGWFIAVIFAFVCVFTTFIWNNKGHPATMMESAMYGGTYRLLWSLMLLWVVYICMNGKASIVVSILSWETFVFLDRLTFMVYLIHPIIQLLFLGQLKYVLFSDLKIMMILFLGFLVTSYILAFAACLICESPVRRLFSILFVSKSNKTL